MIAPFYEDDSVTLYYGDCRDILPTLGMVDHVITDPPYSEHVHKSVMRDVDQVVDLGFAAIDKDLIQAFAACVETKIHRWIVVFSDVESSHLWRSELKRVNYTRTGAWVRNGAPQFSGDRPAVGFEAINIFHSCSKRRWNGGGKHGVWSVPVCRWNSSAESREHTTQKPVKLMRMLVEDFTDPGETILDPFAGSGTTLVAAKALGRKAIGIEKERKYCDVIVRRLSQEILPLTFNQPKKETDDGRNEQNLFAREPGKASRGKRARDDEAR